MKNSSLFIILQRMRLPFLVIIFTYTIAIIGLLIIDGVTHDGKTHQMTIFDAFYFVSYMATTIGFGETPYTFTYSQRIWVTFSIYLTVLGWFYSIGTLVSLLQDKLFLQEMQKAKFLRQVKNLKEKFIIILGYNQITSQIIQKALEEGIRTVVIEKDKNKINELILENFTPTVPVLYAENYNIKAFEAAGIKKKNCKAIVSLFEEDAMNLRVALSSKLLNKYIKVVAKATTLNTSENLKDVNTEHIINPFSIISTEIKMALFSPSLFRLEKWLYKIDNLNAPLSSFPRGKYIICGYGRLGKKIYEKLHSNGIDVALVELDEKKVLSCSQNEMKAITLANADDREILSELDIQNCEAIIAATNDDTTNLSILATAKKLNPKIRTIVRENEMEDFSIFESANIDHVFMPSKILINKTTNALISPMIDEFIKQMIKKDESWAQKLIKDLIDIIDEEPLLYQLKINKKHSPQICTYLEKGKTLKLKLLARSLYNQEQTNNVIPLLLKREEKYFLLPSLEMEFLEDDIILFACDEVAREHMQYICLNIYEFYYALKGKERSIIFKGKE